MENKKFSGSWKEIWNKKGEVEGTKDDILIYDGWENSQADMLDVTRRIISFMDIREEDYVLEVGCGAGGLARFINSHYIGIDFSESLVRRCMEFYQKSAIYCEANSLLFRDSIFDKTFSFGVFSYFPNWSYAQTVVEEMLRVTKDGGTVFIGDIPMKSHDVNHMLYSPREFEKMGFNITEGWAEPYTQKRFNAWIIKE